MSRLSSPLHQTALHLGSRLASVGLSFILFTCIGRLIQADLAAKVYFFTFALGFAIATCRMVLQLGANVTGTSATTTRIRAVQQGYRDVAFLMPVATLILSIIVWNLTASPLLCVLSVISMIIAAADVDMPRSTLNKAPIFSFTFALGTAFSIFLIIYVVPKTIEGVGLAVVGQWLPFLMMNRRSLRFAFESARRVRRRAMAKEQLARTTSIALISCYDGVILNAPFFGFLALSARDAIDLSLIMRVHVASLPLLPLIMHWCNSSTFDRLCQQLSLSRRAGFFIGLALSGLSAGAVFLSFYAHFGQQPVGVKVFVLYAITLLCYSIFAPEMRFSTERLPTIVRIKLIAGAIGTYLITLLLFSHERYINTLTVCLSQWAALLGMTFAIRYFSHKQPLPPT